MSARKFQVGDRVRVNRPGDEYHGERCIVEDGPCRGTYHADGFPWPLSLRFGVHYSVNLEAEAPKFYPGDRSDWHAVYLAHELEPYEDDRNDAAQWADCVWRPTKETA